MDLGGGEAGCDGGRGGQEGGQWHQCHHRNHPHHYRVSVIFLFVIDVAVGEGWRGVSSTLGSYVALIKLYSI